MKTWLEEEWEVEYDFDRGQNDPPYPACVDLTSLKLYGFDLSEMLDLRGIEDEEVLKKRRGFLYRLEDLCFEHAEREVVDREADKADWLYEQARDRKLEERS
jgi:hypothetical protein